MIEKLKCCLAHPMTALRALKEKINEVITGHNELVEKVDNLPTGGGGGGGGASIFAATLTVDADSMFEHDNCIYFNATADKSYPEMKEAYINGAILQCLESVILGNGERLIIPLTTYGLTENVLFFQLYNGGTTAMIQWNYSDESGDNITLSVQMS